MFSMPNSSQVSETPAESKFSRRYYIVVDSGYGSNDIVTELDRKYVENAFELLSAAKAAVAKCSASKVIKLTQSSVDIVFVIASFQTDVYLHLQKYNYYVYSGMAMSQSLLRLGSVIRGSYSLFSLAMVGMEVTFDGLPADKEQEYVEKVRKLSAVYTPNFCETTTHLIALECNPYSPKYQAAAKTKVPVMTVEWIDDAWDESVAGNMEYFAIPCAFKRANHVPLFKNCVVTCSGFTEYERGKIVEVLEKNGAQFAPNMRKNECTHLIINTTTGQKYKKAKEWGIKIVLLKWMLCSVQRGYRLPESLFKVGQTCSTQNELNLTFMDPGYSAILGSRSNSNSTTEIMLKNMRILLDNLDESDDNSQKGAVQLVRQLRPLPSRVQAPANVLEINEKQEDESQYSMELGGPPMYFNVDQSGVREAVDEPILDVDRDEPMPDVTGNRSRPEITTEAEMLENDVEAVLQLIQKDQEAAANTVAVHVNVAEAEITVADPSTSFSHAAQRFEQFDGFAETQSVLEQKEENPLVPEGSMAMLDINKEEIITGLNQILDKIEDDKLSFGWQMGDIPGVNSGKSNGEGPDTDYSANILDKMKADDTTMLLVKNLKDATKDASDPDSYYDWAKNVAPDQLDKLKDDDVAMVMEEKKDVDDEQSRQKEIEDAILANRPLEFLSTDLRKKISTLVKNISANFDTRARADTQDSTSQHTESIIMHFETQAALQRHINVMPTEDDSVLIYTPCIIENHAAQGTESNGTTH